MKVMLLSAGLGTRLKNLTQTLPKPMLTIEGKPLLEYLVRHLVDNGFNEIVINLHYMPELIQSYFGDGSRFGASIQYSYEDKLMGTAGGTRKKADFFRKGEYFLVHYGDILTDQIFAPMINFHCQQNALATLLLHQRANSNSIVSMDQDQRIIGFLERPTEIERKGIFSPWVNSGVFLCAPTILDLIPPETICDFPRDIFVNLVNTNRLFGFPLSGYRCAIDSPERLEEARNAIRNGWYKQR